MNKRNGHAAEGSLWSVVLAGGDGERLRDFTERWLGRYVPKQFCAFVGTRSMLQHTLERALQVSSAERTVTVVARSHRRWAKEQIPDPLRSGVLYQPVNRGTAVGIFLALARVRRRDPKATVVFLPSDHFVYPETRFVGALRDLAGLARAMSDRLVLMAAHPDTVELDYGWIYPGKAVRHHRPAGAQEVHSFIEKPDRERAREARNRGALWNTMVMATRVSTLWNMGREFLPDLMPYFERLTSVSGTPAENDVLDSVYAEIPPSNFSSDLLQSARRHLAMVRLEGVLWSDWGRPERIRASLRQVGKVPAWRGVGYGRRPSAGSTAALVPMGA